MKFMIILIIPVLVNACAHHNDVRPFDDNINKVSVAKASRQAASRSALGQADHYCEKSKKNPQIIEENCVYTGELNEKDYNENLKARGLDGDSDVSQYLAQKFAGLPYVCELKFKCALP
jgi:hypothetical protein